jgi:predicted dehydrogenase
MAEPVGVAVVGCGTISDEYLRNLTSFADLRVLLCADLDAGRAKAQAARYGVPGAGDTVEAMAHPDVELVVNLTVPAAHAAVTRQAVAAGKHVWTEKPDTPLGAGLQTARRLVMEGVIGVPQTGLALLQDPGPDRWHPDPEFLFQPGAGPLFDMGPYYLAALATLFGPAERVAAIGRQSRDQRVIRRGPRAGSTFGVAVPTHVTALVGYALGPAATLVLSFDSPLRRHGFLEITGTEATLALPDPNRFDGEIRVRPTGSDDWTSVPAAGATTASRGLGVLDMARALRAGVPHRAPGELALHVLETMEAIARSASAGAFEPVRTTFTIPDLLAADWDPHARTMLEAT